MINLLGLRSCDTKTLDARIASLISSQHKAIWRKRRNKDQSHLEVRNVDLSIQRDILDVTIMMSATCDINHNQVPDIVTNKVDLPIMEQSKSNQLAYLG